MLYVGIALTSAAALAFEIALVRLFSLAQFYHFAFLAISLALLGNSAGGSLLAAFPTLRRGRPAVRLSGLAALASLGVMLSYALVNWMPFDSFTLAWDRRQLAYMAALYAALCLPFLFSGLVVGWLLAARPGRAHRVYAANLIGSATGCVIAPALLAGLGMEGAVACCAFLAASAALAFACGERGKKTARPHTIILAILALALAGLWVAARPCLDVRLSPYKDLSQMLRHPDVTHEWSRWNAYSRVDKISGPTLRSLPGLSFVYMGALPAQAGLTFDGDDFSPITLAAPEQADFASALPGRVAYLLRPGARVLVLEARGGLDVLAALAGGAQAVTAVEPNPLAVQAVRQASGLYDDPRVRVVSEESRAHVRRSRQSYDVIVLALAAPYRPITSGAYSLAEEYTLTQEAFDDYVARLNEGGILVVTRWLQTPPSEEVRALALMVGAARRAGLEPARSLAALRGYRTITLLLKRGAWRAGELETIRAFAAERKFDLAAAPGLEADQSNLYNILSDDVYFRTFSQVLSAPDVAEVLADYPFDVTPPTDERPFFGHYFRWAQAGQVLAQIGSTWQPFGGAGYFVLAALLAMVTLASALFILLPLVKTGMDGENRRGLARTLIYFGALGLGFMGVEIPLVQRFILYVERPVYAFSAVVFGLLLFSGLGSLSSRRAPLRAALGALVIMALAYPWIINALVNVTLGWPLAARLALTVLSLAPLGFLMGTPFPAGLARLERRAPDCIPWAWAVNGSLSVIGSVGAAMIALSGGFTTVLLLGAACYGAALLACAD